MMADGVGSNLQTYSVQDAVNEVYHMVHRLTTEYGTIPTRKNVAVLGKLQTFSEKFFDDAYPFFGNDDNPKMKIMTEIVDSTKTLPNVLLWDAAAQDIFHISGKDLMAKWSECDDTAVKAEVLRIMNGCQNKEFKFLGSLQAWIPSHSPLAPHHVRFHVECVVPLA